MAQVIPLADPGLDDLADDAPDLDPVTFDAREVRLSKRALDAWHAPPWKLERLIRTAMISGYYWRTPAGGHLLETGRHQVLLSRDGRLCVSYALLPKLPPVPSGPPVDDLTPPAWDREAVVLSRRVVRLFTGRHRVSEADARAELFALLDDAVTRGQHARSQSGHWLWLHGHTLLLTPDGKTLVGYRTRHIERTPSEVRGNAPSRFGGSARAPTAAEGAAEVAAGDRAMAGLPAGQWLPAAEARRCFLARTTRITGGVIGRDRADRALHVQVIREALQRAAFKGSWQPGTDGRHLLCHAGRKWTIAANGKGVLACDPPWPAGEDGAGLTPEELAIPLAQDRAVAQVPPERWLVTSDVRERFDPWKARITAGVIGWDQLARARQVKAIRTALREAAASGQWRPGSEGRHLLKHEGREWVIAANGLGVLACDPPWSPEDAASHHDQADPQLPVLPAAPAGHQAAALSPAAALAGWLRRLRPRSRIPADPPQA